MCRAFVIAKSYGSLLVALSPKGKYRQYRLGYNSKAVTFTEVAIRRIREKWRRAEFPSIVQA